jgi:hypothetical protein
MSFAIKILYEQLSCLLGHLMFANDPVEKKEIIAKIKEVREQLNDEEELERRISHMYLNEDPSLYF